MHPMRETNLRHAAVLCVCAVVVAASYVGSGLSGTPSSYVVLASSRTIGQNQAPTVRPWLVTASRYAFEPPRIEVLQDDLVKIELRTEDIAHSLTIDAYRIAKRVSPGQPVTFEFRADQPGTFPFYCNLQIDDGCRKMRGELVVKARK
jgi:heme/copper-type cytochrome/quinol oxidase subunit 2